MIDRVYGSISNELMVMVNLIPPYDFDSGNTFYGADSKCNELIHENELKHKRTTTKLVRDSRE